MLRIIITIAILLNFVGLHAQKSNPRGIYHMVSITGKDGIKAAMFDQYKICTDSMTWMLSITEDRTINKHGERANRPFFELGDNDHMVFNYTGEEPDAIGPTKTRIYNSGKKGFTMKWWSTFRNHAVFPENGWCTEEYKSNSYSASGEKIFDMLYSTKIKTKKDGLQGRWKVVGAIKMSGSKIVDEWLKSGKLDLHENDYVPYHDKYAIIDDQYVFTAYNEALNNQQPPSSYGYLQEYKVSDENRQTITAQLLTNDNTQPVKYVFHRISDDRMIVKEEYVLFDYRSRELSDNIYAIWERMESNTPIIKRLTTTSPFKDKPMIAPRGLYRYVAGGDPCRIRELRDSAHYDSNAEKWGYTEIYQLCTDTINWSIAITDDNPNKPHGVQDIENNILDYQPKYIYITDGASSHKQVSDAYNHDRWVLFDCSETGFSESWHEGIWTYDKRGVTPLAKEVLNVFDGKIPYDVNHPLYGTWEVAGQVRNPSDAKIDSIMKGLCTDYVSLYTRNVQIFYAFTPLYRYTLDPRSRFWIDKLDSDGNTSLVTWETIYSDAEQKRKLVFLNWTAHWVDKNTLLLCRDKEELRIITPRCFVLKRKVGGNSLLNVLNRKPPVHI